MSEVSSRAQAILDAIEQDAQERRLAMASGIDGPLAGAGLLRSATRPPLRPAPRTPTAVPALPPTPTVSAPIAPAQVAAPVAHDPTRILALVDRVVEQTERAQRRLQQLDDAVNALTVRFAEEGVVAHTSPVTSTAPPVVEETVVVDAPAVDETSSTVRAPLQVAAPVLPPEPVQAPAAELGLTTPPGSPGVITDGARLVAIEMAVAGFTRSEVRDRLSREYGIADATPVLDDVYGAGSDGDSRMPWGAV